jgi:hypothetical protein
VSCGWLGIDAVPCVSTTHGGAITIAWFIAFIVWGFPTLVTVVIATVALPLRLKPKELKTSAQR